MKWRAGRFKFPKQEFTAEFKELAVKRVQAGESVGSVASDLGLVEQTLRNWVKLAKAAKLPAAGTRGRFCHDRDQESRCDVARSASPGA